MISYLIYLNYLYLTPCLTNKSVKLFFTFDIVQKDDTLKHTSIQFLTVDIYKVRLLIFCSSYWTKIISICMILILQNDWHVCIRSRPPHVFALYALKMRAKVSLDVSKYLPYKPFLEGSNYPYDKWFYHLQGKYIFF